VFLGEGLSGRRLSGASAVVNDCIAPGTAANHTGLCATFLGDFAMQFLRVGYAHPLEDLRDEMDRLWSSLTTAPPLHGWTRQATKEAFPAINLFETDESVCVEAELPGIEPETLEITAVGDELTLKGRREEPAVLPDSANADAIAKLSWHRRERGVGEFTRRLSLPALIDAEGVEARLSAGVLTVTCPKAAACRPRKVKVTNS
jgi:HSP20 family protein